MIIGFFGQAESGKDTAADYLVSEFGYTKVAFADVMKRIARDVWDFSAEQLWGPQELKNKPDPRFPLADGSCLTPRRALQVLGTEVGRNIYQDTWVDYAMRTAAALLKGGCIYHASEGLIEAPTGSVYSKGVVISDVRFMNEIKSIHRNHGYVVRLKREGKTGIFAGGIKGHASETEMQGIQDSEVDDVIQVTEGIPEFHKQLYTMMNKTIQKR
jgi:hypothetical protein